MAGKKVRCKKCSEIFEVPAGKVGVDPASDGPDLSGISDEEAPAPRQIAARVDPKPAPRRPSVLPPVSSMSRDDDDGGGEDDSEDPDDSSLTANPAFGFAGSEWIEAALPIVLVIVAIGWMVAQSLHTDDSGRNWAGHLRWFAYLAAYTVIVYPITLFGVRSAGNKARFGMAVGHLWKVFAVFSLPFMLGIILTLTGVGSIANFITGIIVGLVISLGAFLFLYRLRPEQMGTGLGITSAYYLGGCALAAMLGIGINVVLISALKPAETAGSFPKSPLGPAFSWPEPPVIKHPRLANVDANKDSHASENPTTVAVNGNPTTTVPPATTASNIDTNPVKPLDGSEGTTLVPAPDKTMTIASVIPKPLDPATTPTTPTTVEKPAQIVSPLLAKSPVDSPIGEFDDIYFSNLGGSQTAIVVKARGPIADTLEVWGTQPFEKKGTLAPPHPLNEHPVYWVAQKGTTIARMIDFPKKAVEVRLTAEDRAIRTIELDTEKLGSPQIVGFAANNQLGILWDLNGKFTLDMFDVTTGQRTRNIDLPGFEKYRGNLGISPDGRYVAAAVKPPLSGAVNAAPGPLPAIQISDVSGARLPPRIYPIIALASGKPLALSSISFSTEGQKFSMLYEEGGNNLIVTWKPPDTKQLSQYNFFSERTADANIEYHGQALEWLPGANTWLFHGQSVVEADRVLGDFSFADVRGHHRLSVESIGVIIPAESGKLKMSVVTLNAEKFAVKEVAKPTTRVKP